MAIDKQIWQKAKALYELGRPLSQISKETGIAKSGISMKANKEGWVAGKLNEIVRQKVDATSSLENVNEKIEQLELKIEQQLVNKEVDDILAIQKGIVNLQKGAINLHNIVIKKTLQQTQTGEMSVREASQILANSGLKVDQIHKMNNPEPTTAIQINNGEQTQIKLVGE